VFAFGQLKDVEGVWEDYSNPVMVFMPRMIYVWGKLILIWKEGYGGIMQR